MDKFEKFFAIIFTITALLIIFTLSSYFTLAITLLLILVAILVQKFHNDEMFSINEKKNKIVEKLLYRLAIIQKSVSEISFSIKSMNRDAIEKIEELRHDYQVEMEKQYRDLARKMIDLENKLNNIKKNLGIAYSSIDERLRRIEDE